MISWKSVQQQIEKNMHSMKINPIKIRNLNSQYEQTTDLKSYFETYYPEAELDILNQYIEKEQVELEESKSAPKESNHNEYDLESNKSSKIDFAPNQLMTLPSDLEGCLPDFDKLYLYGVPRSDSFLMAITLIAKKDFLFYDNKKQKEDHIKDKKIHLAMCLRDYYKEYNYRMLGEKRSDMENELIESNELGNANRWYIANYYKVNIVLLNLTANTYSLISAWNEEYPVVIMVLESDIYLPILNNQGENIFPNSIIKDIKTKFEEFVNPLITSFDKKLKNKQKKEAKDTKNFKDLSQDLSKNPKSDEVVNETESETDSEDEYEDMEGYDSDIKLEITNEMESSDEEVIIKKKVSLKKSPIKLNNTESQLKKMNLSDLKTVAKENNICITKDSKQKKKADLLDEILKTLF